MYGSQFHSQQALTITRPSTEALKNKIHSLPSQNAKQRNTLTFLFLILVTALVSNASFAGSKESQLKGGNGSATGRP
jgi:hypothetical protein